MNGLPRADAGANTTSMADRFIDFYDFFIDIKLRHAERAGADAGQAFDEKKQNLVKVYDSAIDSGSAERVVFEFSARKVGPKV